MKRNAWILIMVLVATLALFGACSDDSDDETGTGGGTDTGADGDSGTGGADGDDTTADGDDTTADGDVAGRECAAGCANVDCPGATELCDATAGACADVPCEADEDCADLGMCDTDPAGESGSGRTFVCNGDGNCQAE